MYYRLEILSKNRPGEWQGIFRCDMAYHSDYPEFKDLMIKLSMSHRNPIQEIQEWYEENKKPLPCRKYKNEFIKAAQTYPNARFYFTEKALKEIGWILESISRFSFVRLIEIEDLTVVWASPYEVQCIGIR